LEKSHKNLSEKIESNEQIQKELMQEIFKTARRKTKRLLHVNEELKITDSLKNESAKLEKY
jgi:hypothetical protein